ncbi:MAG: SDR family oxidoreductase [Cytophagia bacterium]|nr:MAG: SDR family oxidoreductase [Runella sp.]TAG24427.1 MAG: SDR family oxidoreductase [Cytophagales bacterium]TAG35243.1 MAG: SDR family oxidoreductase [Cytophagia bacterium]TAG58435.1 MAG: SDR family oxidoreductase [Runella slithyformis]TAG72313.1 MAG: SDR family oxidoreductase [Runella slithyformis]
MPYALITGASRGIGRAIVDELARRQYDLLLVARSETELRTICQNVSVQHGIKTDYLVLDLSVNGAPQRVLDWCKHKNYAVSMLVNNAGYGLSGNFESQTLEDNSNMVQLNVVALMQLCQLFLPQLKQQPKAYIMNIVSTAAYQAVPGLGLYAATKSLVLGLSRALSYELRGSAVSVTAVSPGATDTAFVDRAQIGEKGRKAAAKVNMQPQEVAKIAVEATLAGKTEVVVGWLNKLTVLGVWLLPKWLIEKLAAGIYE